MSKNLVLSVKEFYPNQVVFIKVGPQSYKPAKIVLKSSYGTYLVQIYGNKDASYVSEYTIVPYIQQLAQSINEHTKKNKKQIKFLKSAEKDHALFLKKPPEVKMIKICKEEEEEVQEEVNPNQFQNKTEITTKYEAILNIKPSSLIEDYQNTKQTTFSYKKQGVVRIERENSKELLMKKLFFAFDDIILERANQQTEMTITTIMESQIIEPIQYVTTSLFNKLYKAIELAKKHKKVKLRNYLNQRHEMVLSGVENYLGNYTIYLNLKQKFEKFLKGEEKTEAQRSEESSSISISQNSLYF